MQVERKIEEYSTDWLYRELPSGEKIFGKIVVTDSDNDTWQICSDEQKISWEQEWREKQDADEAERLEGESDG